MLWAKKMNHTWVHHPHMQQECLLAIRKTHQCRIAMNQGGWGQEKFSPTQFLPTFQQISHVLHVIFFHSIRSKTWPFSRVWCLCFPSHCGKGQENHHRELEKGTRGTLGGGVEGGVYMVERTGAAGAGGRQYPPAKKSQKTVTSHRNSEPEKTKLVMHMRLN